MPMVIVTAAHPTSVAAQDSAALSYHHDEETSLTARLGDKVLWEFHYGKSLPKPYFHPVAASDGSVLTWNSPPDHPWHHGLWFAWKYINGVNYWEPNGQTGKPDGRTQWDDVEIQTLRNNSTSIRMQLTYRHLDDASVLNEERSIIVSAPDREGTYHFDWTSTFTAVADKVVLDRTPLPDEPGGEVYGGYAGLSVRFAKELAQREATSSVGPIEFTPQARYRGRATALDYAGEIDGRPMGIAICDHPANLNHPSPWYVIRSNEMSYYSPAVICYAPYTMKAGDTFTLRYRVIVHAGQWDAARLAQEFDRFAAETPTGKTVTFSGRLWDVKSSGEQRWGPGPNYFSDSRDNVWVDDRNHLHLRITRRGESWHCAEVGLRESLGLGSYRFRVAALSKPIDRNAVLGLFTWSDDEAMHHREIDIELAQWGDPQADNTQYVVQPYTASSRLDRFDLDLDQSAIDHSFQWSRETIAFESLSSSNGAAHKWTFQDGDIPAPGDEKARINLWLFQGKPPADGEEMEVVIESFEFRPLDQPRQEDAPGSKEDDLENLQGQSPLRACSHALRQRRDSVAILSDNLPSVDGELVQTLVTRLRQDGFDVTELTALQVCDKDVLKADKFFLYVIPQCRTYPAAGLAALQAFAQHGGHVFFLGGPLLDEPLWHGKDGWLNRRAVLGIKGNAPLAHRPFPAASLSTVGWIRTCNDPKIPGAWDVVPEGPHNENCFRFSTGNLTGWDGYLSPETATLFGPRHDLFAFMAKGSATTPQIAVEIQERDGSRWFATADIGPQWQRISLDPLDFKYWPDSSTRDRRGQAGDRLQPAQAVRVDFQLSQSHTAAVAPGEHTFWIADIGTCANPVADLEQKAAASDQSLESIFPRYKVYSLGEPVELQASLPRTLLTDFEPLTATNVVCAIPRTMGRGFERGQKWRYIPLLDAVDKQGRQRGSPAWLLLNNDMPYRGTAFACLGLNDATQLSTPTMLDVFARTVRRLATGLFLVDAGSEHFSYWPQEKVTVGAKIANFTDTAEQPTVRMTLRDQAGNVLLADAERVAASPHDSTSCRQEVVLPTADPSTYWVSTELIIDDKIADRIEHEFAVLDTRTAAADEFVTVRGNDFYLRGKKWYPVGINFWPLYVSGMDHSDFWAGWSQRTYYDPELVEQDLARMQALGINMVSIQSHEPRLYRNLLDFVRRCGRHDIYVNLFCGLASPIAFQEDQLRALLQEARLADNPTIMAYDTIWEPGNYMFGKDWRPRWDEDWRHWIVERYGSLEAAEADWAFKCPRNDKDLCVAPPENYFREDGPWRTLMAAYRRFMDDLMSRKWNQANRTLRQLDPHHLISFRQGNTLPHDFALTAPVKHIDFICPEGYAIGPGEEGYFAAGFITKFVHFTTKGKPIVWSEFGQSVWDATTMDYSPERIRAVADYHELFYRMAVETGANGTVPWWWPGGYREGEQSDYGVVNPDGTPRPAADLISLYGPQLKAPRDWPAPTTWFELDQDAHAGGYWYVSFNTGRAAYQQAVAAGKHLGIRTTGTGTNSADTPLLAVGNRPCNGANPPKYLNAEFNWVQILDAAGNWIEAQDGATITVASATPARARVSVGNTQEAKWLAPAAGPPRIGDVLLVTTETSVLQGSWPLPRETPCLADADFGEIVLAESVTSPIVVELQMSALQRTQFGEKRRFTITPQTP